MDKYLYVAMTGASQNALAQKAHANNLANISTNGFQTRPGAGAFDAGVR